MRKKRKVFVRTFSPKHYYFFPRLFAALILIEYKTKTYLQMEKLMKKIKKHGGLLIISTLNVFICLFLGITGDEDSGASTYLLGILMINFAIYCIYYGSKKYCNRERLHVSSCIYFFVGMMLMVPSIYFFSQVKVSGREGVA